MADKAYAYMDWPKIESVIYAEEQYPKSVMAPRKVREGMLYQCFLPGAQRVYLVEAKSGKRHVMHMEDEAGYFAAVLPGRKETAHFFEADGVKKGDPYAVPSMIDSALLSRFAAGVADRAYRLFGAREAEYEGEKGLLFVLWAPGAVRASVVGPFCSWDGRAYPMEYDETYGIYELFIPGLKSGTAYKYELKLKDGLVYTRPDPYAFAFLKGEGVSVASDLKYRWHDREYLEKRRKQTDAAKAPVVICECQVADLFADAADSDVIRGKVDAFVKHTAACGYTHVELTPIMEYADPSSNGYHTTGYFAPASAFGEPQDYKYLIDRLHSAGIGVILDWNPGQFSPDPNYLASFDGTCLYEHLDPRQGVHPLWGTRLFNHGRAEVRSFLISNAVFWIREYHADGLRVDGGATILRQDYKRGEWVANLYGSGENLEGIEFLKRLTAQIRRDYPEVLLILEEDADFPDTTSPVEEEGLGFDFEWNLHFTGDVKQYLSLPASARTDAHQLLENGMLQHYLKRSVISFSRSVGAFDPAAFLSAVSGTEEEKAAALRTAYVYLFAHPGKKLLSCREEALAGDEIADLAALLKAEPALYEADDREEGFTWIHTPDSEKPVLVFMRKTEDSKSVLLAVINFSDQSFQALSIGVPYEGRYKELISSDDEKYGGSGAVNPRARSTKKQMTDAWPDTLRLRLAAQSASLFRLV